MKKTHVLFTFVVLILTSFVNFNYVLGQQVNSYVKVDTVKVGDKFDYVLVVKKNKQYDNVIYPDSSQFGDWFHVAGVKQFKKTDYSDSLIYTLQFFGVRDTLIPPLNVAFVSGTDTTVKKTYPVPIHFKSEVGDKKDAKFQPLKPIFEFALSILPYIIILILLIIIGYFAYKYYLKKKNEEKTAPKPKPVPKVFVDPLEELEKNLFSLRSDDSLTNQQFKTFYSKLGDTIRLYFERVYHITALELTTRELIGELDTKVVDRELFKITNKILRQADMVKFAKYTPVLDQAYDDLKAGEEFLTRAREIDQGRVNYMRQRFEEENRQVINDEENGEEEVNQEEVS